MSGRVTRSTVPKTDGLQAENLTPSSVVYTDVNGLLTTIAPPGVTVDSITNALLADAAAYTLKGNITSSTSNPTDNTQTQIHTLLSLDGEMLDETRALVFQMTTKPYSARLHLIDWVIQTLKTGGVWTKLDVLYVMAANDATAACLNWKNPGTFTLVPTSSPTFTADHGYAGDGAASYLITGYDPSAASVGMTLNSAHIGIYTLTINATANFDFGSVNGTARMRVRTGTESWRMCSGTDSTGSFTEAVPAYIVANRPDSANQDMYVNGVASGTAAVASTSLPTGLTIGKSGSASFTDRQWAYAHAGTSLTAAESLLIYNTMNVYLSEVGAI